MTTTLSLFQAVLIREAALIAETSEPGALSQPQWELIARAQQIVTDLPPNTPLREETLELFRAALIYHWNDRKGTSNV